MVAKSRTVLRLPRFTGILLVGSAILAVTVIVTPPPLCAQSGQDRIVTGISIGEEKVRLAAPPFQFFGPNPDDATLAGVFTVTLQSDLRYSGLVALISPSFYPLELPSDPSGLNHDEWITEPANAHMLAYGNMQVASERMIINAWLSDVRNAEALPALTKRYRDELTEEGARRLAHKFAEDIIAALSGGQPGIAQTQMIFVSTRSGHKEIWIMDYDGYGQRQVTRCPMRCLTPRWSPNRSRIAYTAFVPQPDKPGVPRVDIQVHSLLTNRRVTFPVFGGTTVTPAWAPDGLRMAFSSSRSNDPEIYTSRNDGSELERITFSEGVDISPVWNPRTGAQIVFVSDRGGRPQLYIMNSDGSNVERLTSGEGHAVDPAWSPNGQMIAFAWQRRQSDFNIYVLDIATRQAIQVTRDAGRNEKPDWAPDGRHLVFESTRGGTPQIWSMLVDGTQIRPLTFRGQNTAPKWSPQ